MDNRFPVKTEENIDYQVMPRQFALNTNHDKEKPFQCVSCNAGFLDKNGLNGHFEAVKKNPLQCTICHSIFTRRGSLKNHISTVHEGNKPFQCSTCKRCFITKEKLTGHIATVHEREKPYECLVCCLTFADKWRLKRHIAAVHEGEKPFQCVICAASFTQNGSLKRHVDTVHENTANSMTTNTININTGLNNHQFMVPPLPQQQVHGRKMPHKGKVPLLCPICNTSFTRRGSLKRHIDTVHERST